MKNEKLRVPKLRFKEFSGEWEENIFKNIVKLQRGSSPRPIVKYITNSVDGVNWIKIGDIINGKNFINRTEEKITNEGAKKSRKVNKGEIILSNSMSYGKPIILNIDGYIHDGWFVIREFSDYFDKEYLLQVLGSEWIQKQYKRLAAGGVVNNISSELVNSVKINLPQKQEQEKIASFLSSIDKKINQLSKKDELLQNYKKAMMQKIFSQKLRFKKADGSDYPKWQEKKLCNYGRLINGLTYSPNDITENGLLVLRSSNIQNGKISFKDNVYVNIDVKDEYLTKENDILICVRNGSKRLIGKSIIIKSDIPKSTHGAFMTVFRGELNKLISHWLQTSFFFKQVHQNLGATINSINGSDLKKFKVYSPSDVEEQTKIANFLSSLDTKISQNKKALKETQKFKKALLQKMFV
ncbi:MAG: restriction endonuclease subunit S [Campylobacteraceae bacterium]|nr:restriction endonuclease subunit S [Campylobacteraceae bacterium]